MNLHQKSLTSRELARLIGVSQSAISRAYTPGASISESMRTKIMTAAQQYGYEPNAIASMLSTKRSSIVGIVISEMRNPYYPVLLEKLTHELQKHGQQTLLFNITAGADIKQQLRALRLYNIDALVIIASTVLTNADLLWATQGRKSVLLNRFATGTGINAVCCDDKLGSRAIAEHFHARGARSIGYVAGLGATSVGMERRNSFIARAAELGMTLKGDIVAGEYSHRAGYDAAIRLMAENRPDALMFANDILACGGMDALRFKLGLNVPQDIMVAGFDDVEIARWPNYDLTTYRQPIEALVHETILLLGEDKKTMISRLPGELVVRSSSMMSDAGRAKGS